MALLTDIEREIIILEATFETINSMVNRATLELRHYDPESSIVFDDHIKQHHFSILFVDLLASPRNRLFGMDKPYVEMLEDVCNNPSFDQDGSIAYLKPVVLDFKNWLSCEITIEKMWFPSIDLEINLKISRQNFFYVGGNLTKHNFTRQSIVASKMKRILAENGVDKSEEDCLLVLEDFYNWFHGDGNIFGYHANTIAEFLNNLRWGIYRYLQPEHARSYTQLNGIRYEYQYPIGVTHPLAKKYYWDLMHNVRSKPYIPEFKVSRYLKTRY